MRNILRTTISRFFADLPQFFEAENGEEGYNLLKQHPDMTLVILDYNMPVMNGGMFLTKVREESAYNKVRIIMCTAEVKKGEVIEIVKKGVSGYVIKPFTPNTLRKTLQPIVERMGYTMREQTE